MLHSHTKLPVAGHRQLAHPPLREAVIDLRLGEELSPVTFSRVAERQLLGFKPSVRMWRGQVTVQIGPPNVTPPPVQRNIDDTFGVRYMNADNSRIIQLRRDGATFSITQGYTNWANTREFALDNWRRYLEWIRPDTATVTRTAVRYINVLRVPVGADFDLYLTAGPKGPPGMPEVISGFLHRVVLPLGEGISAIVTQALEPPAEGSSSVVIDIDVWREHRNQADSPDIWMMLDELRDIKNRIFFGSVTELALELYK
jgi:uncharacterized protein (TIGR04255 family)